jgi:DNA helicase-2/ATP-dependent DNA helicase PcrA
MPNSQETKSKMLEGLNAAQEKAVTVTTGPLLIIAGAGTGKTTVITRRIAWLIEQNLAQPGQILALTFTDKAANEMLERVDQIMPLGYSEISISTFHAFAQSVLRDHALDIGLPSDFTVLNETQAWMLIQSKLHEFDLDYYRPMGNPTRFIHALLDHFEKAKGEGITPEAYLKYVESLQLATDSPTKTGKKKAKGKKESSENEPTPDDRALELKRLTEVANAYHKYQKMILDLGFLDYSDLINYTIRLFKTRPQILKKYQSKFKYILVDEFQDTDLSQYELVKMLALPENNITVVGDDDQSIYKFRGASISNILKFEDDYPNSSKVTLTDNYRSGQKILDLSYDFIQLNNPERLEARLKLSKKLTGHKPEPGKIEVIHTQTGHEEAVAVADRIQALMASDHYGYNDFAVLVRANDHADPFIAELTKRRMPFMFVANRGLYKKPFILDLIHYLKLLDNYHESDSLFRVINFPKFRMPAADLITITRATKKKGLSVYEALKMVPMQIKVSDEAAQKIQNLLQLLEIHTGLARQTHVTELIFRVLNDLGILKDLTDKSNERSEDIALLRKFYTKAQAFETESDDKTAKGFLDLIRLEQQAGNTGELAFDPNVGPETVKIMTIHSSKGLEFNCVFITNMVEARFPSRDRKEQIELPQDLVNEIFSEGDVHLMEERRLFYVAATRAKKHLFLTWADNYGGTSTKKPSRFLVEAGLLTPAAAPGPTGTTVFQRPPTLPLPGAGDIPLPESFSWTSISSFLKCPLEFKYKHLYQIPWPGNPYTSFGQSIHKAIQVFSQTLIQMNSVKQNDLFGGGKKDSKFEYPPLKKLHEIYDQHWIDEWYQNRAQQSRFKERGYRLLENYYNYLTAKKLLPAEVEKFFRLKLGQYKYIGVIDCIFENPDGSITIVDFKTSQKARSKLERVDKKQLLGYQMAAQEFLHKKVKHMAYWDLEDLSHVIEFRGTDEEIAEIREEFEENIAEIIAAIKNDSFLELDKHKSHDCEFRELEPT